MRYQIALVSILAFAHYSVASAECVGNNQPDIYHSFGIAQTSAGTIQHPQGTIILDTDGFDIVDVSIGGIDVTNDLVPGDHLDGSSFLPGPNNPPFFVSS